MEKEKHLSELNLNIVIIFIDKLGYKC